MILFSLYKSCHCSVSLLPLAGGGCCLIFPADIGRAEDADNHHLGSLSSADKILFVTSLTYLLFSLSPPLSLSTISDSQATMALLSTAVGKNPMILFFFLFFIVSSFTTAQPQTYTPQLTPLNSGRPTFYDPSTSVAGKIALEEHVSSSLFSGVFTTPFVK
jgi:hypothetical protein